MRLPRNENDEVYKYLESTSNYYILTAKNLHNTPTHILKVFINRFADVNNPLLEDSCGYEFITNLDEVKAELKRRQTAKQNSKK